MEPEFDIIILGMGAMGSAAAAHLASRGLRLVGVDRFTPPHTLGSSHGQTRIIREAYFEGPAYVPLVQQAYVNWERLARDSGRQLLLPTGGLMLGYPDSEVVRGALRSARDHGLQVEWIGTGQVKARFPALRPPPGTVAVLEPRAGILFPETCITAHLEQASRFGAAFRFNEAAIRWEPVQDGFRVTTSRGSLLGKKLLLTTGAWLGDLAPDMIPPLQVERQVQYWFSPAGPASLFDPARFPVFIWSPDEHTCFYGFPDLGQGIKVAFHHGGDLAVADRIDRVVHDSEIEAVRNLLATYLPGANGRLMHAAVCMYTNTPDQHFRLAMPARYPGLLVASICSGHGFKFASAFGEILADLLVEGRTRFDLSLFGLSR
ncbi:MAG TPA: N-methyl-L-tryptophan oxidase [Chitinophagaceae bacterium]|nr:N-methyl-L-tryptophan oxidase [Chitinophagaceae bacterium]